jgi:acyltransferase
MPLFFLISGFFFKNEKGTLFYKKKIRRIIIPFLFFSTASFLLYYLPNIKTSKFSILDFLIGTFFGISNDYYLSWNTVLWFLPCLFLSNVLFKITEDYKMKWVLIVLFILGLCFSNNVSVILPYHIITLLLMIPIFYFGIELKKRYQIITSLGNKNKLVLISFVLFISGFFLSMLNSTPDVRVNLIGNPFLFYISAISLILSLLLFSRYINNFGLIWLGTNSLIIMGLHLKVVFISKFLVDKIGFDLLFFVGILESFITCLLLIFPILILNKYLPYLVGKK